MSSLLKALKESFRNVQHIYVYAAEYEGILPAYNIGCIINLEKGLQADGGYKRYGNDNYTGGNPREIFLNGLLYTILRKVTEKGLSNYLIMQARKQVLLVFILTI